MIDLVKNQLHSLSRDQIRRPIVPIATALQEAGDLLRLCRRAEIAEALVAVGVSPEFLRDLEVRLGAARQAQSAWTSLRDRKKPLELLELEGRAFALRRDTLAAARWNLRRSREAQAALDAIRGGVGVADLVQDLFDLAVLLEKHAAAFDQDRSIEVEARAAEAREVAGALSLAVSEVRNGTEAIATRELRDRAFTFMDDLVTELRSAGRYAFRDDPDTARLFGSRHLRMLRLRQRRGAEAEEAMLDDATFDEALLADDEGADEARVEGENVSA